jgi:exosome complex component RRP42
MASPEFEAGRPSEAAVELARVLERGLKQSGALALRRGSALGAPSRAIAA